MAYKQPKKGDMFQMVNRPGKLSSPDGVQREVYVVVDRIQDFVHGEDIVPILKSLKIYDSLEAVTQDIRSADSARAYVKRPILSVQVRGV